MCSKEKPMTKNTTYAIGYGKPPTHTRWTKGQSGNPKGRPPRDRNISALVTRLLAQRIVVRKGRSTKRMSRLDHLVHRMLEDALAGDPRLIRMVLDEARKGEVHAETLEPVLESADREVIDAMLRRIASPPATAAE
jgi:Family of unknown function (DUF5681)